MAAAKRTRRQTATATAVVATEGGEIEEVKGGLGIDDGIVLTTTLLLGLAVVLAYLALGGYPG